MSKSFLIDTHVYLWAFMLPQHLSPKAKKKILSLENKLYLSAASVWEMILKKTAGKLELEQPIPTIINEHIQNGHIEILPINHLHTLQLINLPLIHRDPFDRILIAQALHEKLTLITADKIIHKYALEWLW